MLPRFLAFAVALALFTPFSTAAPADGLRLPRVFGSGMVLQQGKPVSVWGWAEPDSRVTVTFAGQTKSTNATPDSKWSLALDPLPASAKPESLVVQSGNHTLTFDNILVGEVWVCGGQSNMEMVLRNTAEADLELPAADYPEIRFLRLPKVAHLEPQDDFPVADESSPTGIWRNATAGQVENFTAVGYYFARRLHRNLKVPVGIIDNSWGGTLAQQWCSRESLAKIPEVREEVAEFESRLKAWIDGGGEEGAAQRLAAALTQWEKDRAAAQATGGREPGRPNADSFKNPALLAQPAGMFNGSLAPLTGMTIRGVLFYQGENNSFGTSWKPYHLALPAVIADWRATFRDPALPFGIVQIAGWSTRRTMDYDMNHHCNVIREIQFDVWRRTPHTGLIVTFDANTDGNIHPGRKLPVGERSARWALAEVYGAKKTGSNEPLEWHGPVYEATTFADGKALVTFVAGSDRGLRLDKDTDLGFVIAGEDKVFHHAHASLSKSAENRPQLIVWSDNVPAPVAVRYASSNLPVGGLMNDRELPAFPFRSDDWPITPHQSTGSYLRAKTGG